MKRFLLFICLLFFSSFFPAFSQGIITTVAGGGNGGDGSLATNAHLTAPNDVVVDDSGNLYIALETAIRKVDAQTQIISLYAGSYQPGFGCDGCPATQGKLSHASAIAFDPQGNLHIADWGTSRIRKVDALTGMMTTVAGNGSFGYSGDGGAATQAQLSKPVDIAFDGSGNLYIADERYVIRRVDAQTGVITTLAGDGVKGTWNDGDTAVKAQLGEVRGLCIDKSGNVYFSDFSARKISKINTNGVVTTYCGTGAPGISGDGGLAILAKIGASAKIRLDKYGNLFLADGTIRRIDAISGIIDMVAGPGSGFCGDGGPATQACLAGVMGVWVDLSDNFFIADGLNYRVRKVTYPTNFVHVIPNISYKAFPNPTTGEFLIESSHEIKKIEIYNEIGQCTYKQSISNRVAKIDLSFLPDGIYIANIYVEDLIKTEKILLIH